MPKILVISPSGEVYDHDCVRWYDYRSIQAHLDHYHNIGDAFVFDSSLKLLRFDELAVLDIRSPTARDIDRYNAEYDYAFLRGSNYIHADIAWENAVAVLERLRIPVLAFGIGAQAPSEGPLVLSDTTRRVLHLISERSVSIGVRGAFTAEVLWNLGIRNTRIIGCPTLFRRNDPFLRIDLPPLESVRRIGFTVRREVSRAYAKDIARYLTVHRDAITDLARRYDVELMAQGEVEEKKIVLGTPEQRAAALEDLKRQDWFAQWFFNDTVLDLYRSRLFYSDVVADYETLVRGKDLVLGYRLHGNLMALANGVPSIYFTYDSRTTEFVETFQIPAYDVFSGRPFDLAEYWDPVRFERFNRTYHQRYRDLRAFLDENFIEHRMHPDPVPAVYRRDELRKSA